MVVTNCSQLLYHSINYKIALPFSHPVKPIKSYGYDGSSCAYETIKFCRGASLQIIFITWTRSVVTKHNSNGKFSESGWKKLSKNIRVWSSDRCFSTKNWPISARKFFKVFYSVPLTKRFDPSPVYIFSKWLVPLFSDCKIRGFIFDPGKTINGDHNLLNREFQSW